MKNLVYLLALSLLFSCNDKDLTVTADERTSSNVKPKTVLEILNRSNTSTETNPYIKFNNAESELRALGLEIVVLNNNNVSLKKEFELIDKKSKDEVYKKIGNLFKEGLKMIRELPNINSETNLIKTKLCFLNAILILNQDLPEYISELKICEPKQENKDEK